ncbi:MAG: hypothetical protein QUU85_06280, partial [Candidatus Eisenbacteria bacterium]|nr:hypothetical protein [Candidatus Eisenbacteria bacterium]
VEGGAGRSEGFEAAGVLDPHVRANRRTGGVERQASGSAQDQSITLLGPSVGSAPSGTARKRPRFGRP